MKKKVIGIIGGMGPAASNKLCQHIVSLTPASKDQDHIPFILCNNPQIPDRTEAILYQGESPVPDLVKAAHQLENAGADFIVIPCNTAHFFINDLQLNTKLPVINMIQETADFIKNNYPDTTKVGLLATAGTVRSKIFENELKRIGIEVVVPEASEQENLVVEAVYSDRGIKAGYKRRPQILLESAAEKLISRGAQMIIMGCTEIPLALIQKRVPYVLINPTKILAQAAIREASISPVEETASENAVYEETVQN